MALQLEPEWQSEKTLVECIRFMLDKEIATDVCFAVGPKNGDIDYIKAHKFILIARSPVFEAMFSSGMTECNDPEAKVRVEDIDADIFKELMNYMYCESASMIPESAVYLMYAAKKYMLPKLVLECLDCLNDSLDVNNVILYLEQSLHFDHQELKTACLKLISVNAKDVLTGAEILSASRQAITAILETRTMLASELLIYHTAVKWAKHELQSVVLGEPTDLQIRETLGDLLYKIRFPAMRPDEFAEIASVGSQLLTEEEKDSIYYYLLARKNSQLKFPTERRIGEELWTNRVLTRQDGKFWSTPNVDAINFTTDENILLTGIGLYTGYNGREYDVDVEILQSEKSLFKKRCTVPCSDIRFKIALDEPIQIEAGVLYSVKALSHHFIGHYGSKCQTEYTDEGVVFTFFNHPDSPLTTTTGGQIPRLYFCHL